jgi:arylsulfatase A-like enzyme
MGVGAVAAASGGALFVAAGGLHSEKPNVLFIAVDDLRPQLGCFGHKQMISPNIDRLASEGVIFSRCYCQVPVCGASRASLMTGVRPTRKRFVGYDTWAQKDLPGALSVAEHFKNNGYHTISNGKIFHHVRDLLGSWSESPWNPKRLDGNWRDYRTDAYRLIAKANKGAGPAFEEGEGVADNAYADGQTADKVISDLRRLKKVGKPFFLTAGFVKPHLPFNAPKKYWDMYDRDEIDMADNPFAPKDAPKAAIHTWGELRSYHGIPKKGRLSDEAARTLVHGYYACVSYIDAMVGKVLGELDRLGLADNTIVVLWGDHGWNLREHGLWCKHANFDTSMRAPLIVRAPGVKGGKESEALTEFVDIYPSLCELSNVPTPQHVEGTSFVPLLKNPDRRWKKAVFSRYFNGESIRTDRYLYTHWKRGDKQYARMLYDHKVDPGENTNISELPENAGLIRELEDMMERGPRAFQPKGI